MTIVFGNSIQAIIDYFVFSSPLGDVKNYTNGIFILRLRRFAYSCHKYFSNRNFTFSTVFRITSIFYIYTDGIFILRLRATITKPLADCNFTF